jgi:hypothetical protein
MRTESFQLYLQEQTKKARILQPFVQHINTVIQCILQYEGVLDIYIDILFNPAMTINFNPKKEQIEAIEVSDSDSETGKTGEIF